MKSKRRRLTVLTSMARFKKSPALRTLEICVTFRQRDQLDHIRIDDHIRVGCRRSQDGETSGRVLSIGSRKRCSK